MSKSKVWTTPEICTCGVGCTIDAILLRRNRQKRRQRSSPLFEGRNSFNSMLHYRFSTRMILKNRISHSFLQTILVQFILFFNLSWCKIASAARNWINSVTQTAATTFAFSSVFILLLWCHCSVTGQTCNTPVCSAQQLNFYHLFWTARLITVYKLH